MSTQTPSPFASSLPPVAAGHFQAPGLAPAAVYFEAMSAKDFQPREVTYVDANNMFPLFDGLFEKPDISKPLGISGPKGLGKSLSVAAYAFARKIPIITFDCSEDVRRTHLLGTFILRDGGSPFVLGPLTTAFEVANEVGKCILVLEEMNALTPQCQKLLNGVTDFRRRIEVPECKKVFELAKGAKLAVVGTMNTAVYGGVYALNEDLKSRFRMLTIGYPALAVELDIVKAALGPDTLKHLPTKTLDNVLTMAHETRQKAMDYALSTRDIVQLLEDIVLVGTNDAMRLILGKFEGDDLGTMRERVISIFGVKIAP